MQFPIIIPAGRNLTHFFLFEPPGRKEFYPNLPFFFSSLIPNHNAGRKEFYPRFVFPHSAHSSHSSHIAHSSHPAYRFKLCSQILKTMFRTPCSKRVVPSQQNWIVLRFLVNHGGGYNRGWREEVWREELMTCGEVCWPEMNNSFTWTVFSCGARS